MSTIPNVASRFAKTGAPPRSVLVVVTRRIGDVLLATPLIRSIKCAWPSAAIDVLVFEGTQSVINANPDVRRTLTISERPRVITHLAFALRLLRRYEIALSLVPGDRPTLYAWLAGRWRAGLLLDIEKERWKRGLLDTWVPFDNTNTHTMLMHLALAATLGIPPLREVRVTWRPEDAQAVEELLGPAWGRNYVVLHPYPKFNYKMWREQAWIDLAQWLTRRGLHVVLSGSGDAAELAYVGKLAAAMEGPVNLSGKLTIAGAACLLAHAVAYVGPDTALTHMAAALGIPTVALFGPTDPVKWGPWPKDYTGTHSPWRRFGNQTVGCVRLLQGSAACAPCRKEGCDRHIASFSDCLLSLPVASVIKALQEVAGLA